MILTHKAERNAKLISFLREDMGLSASLVSRLKHCGAFFVNETGVNLYYKVKTGDIITVKIEEIPPGYPAEEGEIDILYEDDAIIALDKPFGINMHPTENRTVGTLANRLLHYYRETGQKCAVHFVNRLDRDTFGVVLIAKNSYVHSILCRSLENGDIKKVYNAAVFGHMSPESGTITQPIARLSSDSLLRCVREDGQYAATAYREIKRSTFCSLLELSPITGRTHQLRVHCAFMGCPILGDNQYGSDTSQKFSLEKGLTHQQLCAVSLSFPHPITGEKITILSHQSPKFF